MRRILVLSAVFAVLIVGAVSGQMMGPGFQGYGGMMGTWWNSPPPNARALSMEQAAQNINAYLQALREPDLQLAEMMEFENQFYAEIREKSTGVGAFEMLVDKWTGYVVPEPGPNMMWNTKYGSMGAGMMGGITGGGMMGGPLWGPGQGYRGGKSADAAMPVDLAQAHKYAQDFLDARLPGTAVEKDGDVFYGYYTIHVLNKDGSVYGMLGVNGYSGWVWYHAWHGKFQAIKEY